MDVNEITLARIGRDMLWAIWCFCIIKLTCKACQLREGCQIVLQQLQGRTGIANNLNATKAQCVQLDELAEGRY